MIIYVLMYLIWYIHSLFLVLQTDASLTCIHRYGTMAPESRARHSERWKHKKTEHFPSEYVWILLGLPRFTLASKYPSKKMVKVLRFWSKTAFSWVLEGSRYFLNSSLDPKPCPGIQRHHRSWICRKRTRRPGGFWRRLKTSQDMEVYINQRTCKCHMRNWPQGKDCKGMFYYFLI